MKEKSRHNLWVVESLWIAASAILGIMVILPIHAYHINFPFMKTNWWFVFGFITMCRWLFLWKFTPYARYQLFKLGLIFVMIPLIIYSFSRFYDFRIFLDEVGIQDILTQFSDRQQQSLSVYIRNEMIFFGTAFLITASLIPFKLIRSIWKQYNRNEV